MTILYIQAIYEVHMKFFGLSNDKSDLQEDFSLIVAATFPVFEVTEFEN